MKLIFNILLLFVVSGLMVFTVANVYAQEVNLKPGDSAPEFEAVSDDGEVWRSKDHIGEKLLVVYFYPAAMTGGCTDQACSFRDNRTKLTELGAEVVGVSGDEIKNLQIFKRTNNLNFPLLSDTEGEIARAFGVPVRDGGSITREVDGEEVVLNRTVTASRWTFIIGQDGTVLYKDTNVDAAGDSDAVINAIEQLAGN